MSDDSRDASSSSSSSSSSPSSSAQPASASSSTPLIPSASPPDALHAQAVRFLTSLRTHSPNSSLESQKEFLRSKGLEEDAIEAALRDAKRPDGLTDSAGGSTPSDQQQLVSRDGTSSSPLQSDEQSAFDQAARAFDDPFHTPLPSVPSRNYPRSPLALYYEEQERNGSAPGGDIEAAVRRQEKARRYEVLLGFFRTISYLFTVGGALTGIAVLLYRSFILPRLVTTLGSRSYLLRHHVGLWDNVVGSVRALKRGGAAGAGLAGGDAALSKVKTKAEAEAQGPRKSGERRGSGGLKKVQFADEVDGGKLEEHASGESDPLMPKKITQMGDGKGGDQGKESKEGADANGQGGKSEDDAAVEDKEVEEAKQQEIEPIDVCAPIRQSLATLVQKLRQDRQDDAAAVSATNGAHSATVEDEAESDDDSDDLGHEEEDDVEFDPFVEVNGPDEKAKKRKAAASAKKLAGSKAKKSTSTSLPSPPAAVTTATAPSPLYTSLTTLNASVSARLIASSSAARSFGRHNTAFSFGVPPSAAQQQQNGAASSAEDKTAELSAQIKAEIRSLKGLMLSRRNFPRANLGLLSAAGREG